MPRSKASTGPSCATCPWRCAATRPAGTASSWPKTIYQALKKCPNLTLVRPTRYLYGEYCRRINAIYAQYTDQVEAFSIDESWLDVTGSQYLFGTGEHIADELRRRVREELGLTISVGVSFNKVFAKLGSDYKKPDATTVISRDN